MEGSSSVQTSRGSINPLQEYLLQSSILDNHMEVLLKRLNGLCDSVTSQPESFQDHEMVFHLNAPNVQQLLVHVRRSLDHPDVPWHVRYNGTPDMGDRTRFTLLRSCIDVGTSDNVVQFLQELGFRLDYEFVVKGYVYRKGRMKILVSKIFRMLASGNPDSIEPLSESYLVELSVVAPAGQDQIQEDMKNFAEQLKPLVHLEKVDHRRLQQQASVS